VGAGPNILVVGAGAVGQVFGHHLATGGASVSFCVRERHLEEVRSGFSLHRLRTARRAPPPSRTAGFPVATLETGFAGTRFDQVWLTLPSPLPRGDWLARMVATAGDALMVSLQPGPEDWAALRGAGIPESRLVQGLIGFIAYAAPLPGEALEGSGVAYWFPPGMPSGFWGARDGVEAVLGALKRGGLPARRLAGPKGVVFTGPVLMSLVAALEGAGWSTRALGSGTLLTTAAAACREVFQVLARTEGPVPLGPRVLARPWLMRWALRAATWLAPFPMEAYLQVHFTKVGGQTRHLLESWAQRGRAAGQPVDALGRLLAAGPATGR
jgi:hypothetical protein